MSLSDLKNYVRMGEGGFLEFKKSVSSPEKIAREMCAFANTSGGTILVGVEDNGRILGLENAYEEQFYLEQGAEICLPNLHLELEIIPIAQHRDVLMLHVDESEKKPVYVHENGKRRAYVRRLDESVVMTREEAQIMKKRHSARGVNFRFGNFEQKLFRFLNEYNRISVQEFAHLVNIKPKKASDILSDLASINILTYSIDKSGVFFGLKSPAE